MPAVPEANGTFREEEIFLLGQQYHRASSIPKQQSYVASPGL